MENSAGDEFPTVPPGAGAYETWWTAPGASFLSEKMVDNLPPLPLPE